jgi:hypothetical protein
MLRCKTDSANDSLKGGPVSNSNDCGRWNCSEKAIIPAKYGCSEKLNELAATELSVLTSVARNVLQHGPSLFIGGVGSVGAAP